MQTDTRYLSFPLALVLAALAGVYSPAASAVEELMPLAAPPDVFHAGPDAGEPARQQPERNIVRLVVPLAAYRNDQDDDPISVKAAPAPLAGSTFAARQNPGAGDIFAVPGLIMPEDLATRSGPVTPRANQSGPSLDKDLAELVDLENNYPDAYGDPRLLSPYAATSGSATIDAVAPERAGENTPVVKFVALEPIPDSRHRQAPLQSAQQNSASPPLPEAVGSITMPGLENEQRQEARETATRIASKYKTHVANIPMPKNDAHPRQGAAAGLATSELALTATPAPAVSAGVAPPRRAAGQAGLTATSGLNPATGLTPPAALTASVAPRSSEIDFRSAFASGYAANPDSVLSIAGLPITGPAPTPAAAKAEAMAEDATADLQAALQEEMDLRAARAETAAARRKEAERAVLPPPPRLSETALRQPAPTSDEQVSAGRLSISERAASGGGKTDVKNTRPLAGNAAMSPAAVPEVLLKQAPAKTAAAASERVTEALAATYIPPPPGMPANIYEEEAPKKSITDYASSILPPSFKKTGPSKFDIMAEEEALIAKEKAEFERQKAETAYAKKYADAGVAKGLADLAKKTAARGSGAADLANLPPVAGGSLAPSPASGVSVTAAKSSLANPEPPFAAPKRENGFGISGGLTATGNAPALPAPAISAPAVNAPDAYASTGASTASGPLRPPTASGGSLRPGAAPNARTLPLPAPAPAAAFPTPGPAAGGFAETPSSSSGLVPGITSSGITSGMAPGMAPGLSLLPLAAPGEGGDLGLTSTSAPAVRTTVLSPPSPLPAARVASPAPTPVPGQQPSGNGSTGKKSSSGATTTGKKQAKNSAAAEDTGLPPPLSPQLFKTKNRDGSDASEDDQGFTILRNKKNAAGKKK